MHGACSRTEPRRSADTSGGSGAVAWPLAGYRRSRRKGGGGPGGDPAAPPHHGAAFLALDAAAIGPDLPARIESLIDEIHAAPRAAGVDRLYVPGEKEWENLDRSLRDGIALPPDVVASLA